MSTVAAVQQAKPSYMALYEHCRERAGERFDFNLGLAAYFDMVNGKIPRVVVGQANPRKRKGHGPERSSLCQFAGIPGTWVCRGKWVVTCWEGKIG